MANLKRNIMLDSLNANGTRGYALFSDRANIDIRYVTFCKMGRTLNEVVDNTTFGSNGQPNHIGTNQGVRYAVTALNLFGPTTIPANGYQFTFIGDVVRNIGQDRDFQWGIGISNSSYGLIQKNIVYNVAGVGIGVEQGNEAYNRFDSNFVGRVTGSGARGHMQMQGDGFWFRNPLNYVTNNIAVNINGGGWDVYSYGFSVDANYVGTENIPAYQGAIHLREDSIRSSI